MPAARPEPDTADRTLEKDLDRRSNLLSPVLAILLTIALMVGLVLATSLLIKIAGAVVASGELRVITQKTLIQHPKGGTIAELAIANGQWVEAGQVVLRLDSEQSQLARQKLLTQIDSLERQSGRLRAVLEVNLTLASDASIGQLSAADLDSREGSSIRATIARIRTFNQADQADKTALQRVLDLQNSQIELLERQLGELDDTVTKTESLVKQGLETEIKLKDQRNALRAQQVSLVDARKGAAQSRREMASLEAQISKRIFEFQQTSLDALIKSEDDLERLVAELKQIDEELARQDLRAGLAGRITNLAELNVGAVLRAGDVVAEIIPDDQDVLAEVLVPPSQIDLIAANADAQLELATLKNASEQRLAARVETVAADLKVLENGQSAFPVTLRLTDRSALSDALARNGLPVTAYIPTAERSLAAYLIAPVILWSRKTFTEY